MQAREKKLSRTEKLKGREAILAILARSANDKRFLAGLAANSDGARSAYYTLTEEELASLASGDIARIESWVGRLDKAHATWLLSRLRQEKH